MSARRLVGFSFRDIIAVRVNYLYVSRSHHLSTFDLAQLVFPPRGLQPHSAVLVLSAPMQSLMMVAPFAPTSQLNCQRRQQQTRSQQKSQQQRSQQLARSVALLPFRSDREVRSETAGTVPLRVLGRASQCEPQSDCRARSSLPGNRLRLRRPRALQMTIRPSCRHRRSLPSR